MLLSLALLVAVLVVFLLGLRELLLAQRHDRRLHASVVPEREMPGSAAGWRRLSRTLVSTRPGQRLAQNLSASGVSTDPARVVAATAGLSLVLGLLLGRILSWLLLPVGVAAGVQLTRLWLRRQRVKRREAFIAQMPELARTLSNAASAGLSVRTALAMAADELAEPAAGELRAVTQQLGVGASLERSLAAMEQRLPSREVAILATTLIVSARSGGGLVTALRDIAGTLEARKETRREIRTTYAQAVATAYSVLGLGALVLFALDRIQEGTVDVMLRNPVGQLTVVVAAAVYALGIVIVRRMTRIAL